MHPVLLGIAFCVPTHAQATNGNALVDEILRGADQGQCVESVTYRLIGDQGAGAAAGIVQAALTAVARREQQQRAMGCEGDIAAQAIAAGADPDEVLRATAAGL